MGGRDGLEGETKKRQLFRCFLMLCFCHIASKEVVVYLSRVLLALLDLATLGDALEDLLTVLVELELGDDDL